MSTPPRPASPGERFDRIVRGGRCVVDGRVAELDVGIRAGRIASLGSLARGAADDEIDARGLVVLPGAIDPQVHFREPGFPHKEDLETGTRGAVLGGVTTVLEMPNTDPPTTSAAALQDKLARLPGRAWCDVGFFVGATPNNAEQLGQLERLPGCAGVKIFMGKSTGDLLVHEDRDLERVLRSGRRRVAVHAEDEARLRRRAAELDLTAGVQLHPSWRDEQVALVATTRLLEMARRFMRPVHVLHVTTGEEVDLIAKHRDLATAETTPQHLSFAAPDCYAQLGTLAQMNPPIRDARHRDALWRGFERGVLDCIASDHAPHTLEEKRRPYPQSPSGMPGVQTLLPVMLDFASAGRFDLPKLAEITSGAAARIWRLPNKGRIAVGCDADLVFVDPALERVIERSWIASRCGWSPFEGRRIRGWPVATLLRGEVVMRDGELIGAPRGRAVEIDSSQ